MLLFIITQAPNIILAFFVPFLTIFTLFHLQFLLQSKNLPQIISGTPQFLIGLVNNARNQCQKLCKIFWLLNFLQRRCVTYVDLSVLPFLPIQRSHSPRGQWTQVRYNNPVQDNLANKHEYLSRWSITVVQEHCTLYFTNVVKFCKQRS